MKQLNKNVNKNLKKNSEIISFFSLVIFSFCVLNFQTSQAASTNSLTGLADVLKDQGYKFVKTVYYPEEDDSNEPLLMKDTGEVVTRKKSKKCDDMRAGSEFSSYRSHKVIFGDGDPSNGFEDDRERLSEAQGVASKNIRAVGMVQCNSYEYKNGKKTVKPNAGTASIINVEGQAFIVTSNHLFFEKQLVGGVETYSEVEACYFIPHGVVGEHILIPIKDRTYSTKSENYEASEDIAFAKIPNSLMEKYGSMELGEVSEVELNKLYQKGATLELIGLNSRMKALSVTRKDCKTVARQPGDKSYGEAGVLLHSCDTNGGSSGSVLVLNYRGDSKVVGFHRGMYVGPMYPDDPVTYPSSGGLVEGQPFNPKDFTGVAVSTTSPTFKRLYKSIATKRRSI
jgi:hypothetical protein